MKKLAFGWFALALGLATVTQAAPDYKRTEDVIYGRKFGTALTLDVFQPTQPNGLGIIVMVSGGFFSSFVHSNMAPTLIIHGDADTLVRIYQAPQYVKRCEELGSPVKLIVREGKNHGWAELGKDLELFADWFDEHLKKKEPR